MWHNSSKKKTIRFLAAILLGVLPICGFLAMTVSVMAQKAKKVFKTFQEHVWVELGGFGVVYGCSGLV